MEKLKVFSYSLASKMGSEKFIMLTGGDLLLTISRRMYSSVLPDDYPDRWVCIEFGQKFNGLIETLKQAKDSEIAKVRSS